jgi:hypothetical protein
MIARPPNESFKDPLAEVWAQGNVNGFGLTPSTRINSLPTRFVNVIKLHHLIDLNLFLAR